MESARRREESASIVARNAKWSCTAAENVKSTIGTEENTRNYVSNIAVTEAHQIVNERLRLRFGDTVLFDFITFIGSD